MSCPRGPIGRLACLDEKTLKENARMIIEALRRELDIDDVDTDCAIVINTLSTIENLQRALVYSKDMRRGT